jgi:murein DD-endopeptidase MepM/ murein hydrolase activator NlpD
VLGPPVRAGRWVAVYGPAAERGHRRFLYTIDGRARIPARFAIDWLKLGDDNAFSHGDPTQLTSWYGYGADVLAVADATVADAHDDIAADTPVSSSAPAPIALENASGNYVVLDLGGGRYAFYEHLKPGTIRVAPGARVRRGDVIALLGNTGSSSAGPHLHFHVADANASLGAEGVPYGFDRFDSLGEFQFPDAATGAPARISPRAAGVGSTRRRELPAPNAVVRL